MTPTEARAAFLAFEREVGPNADVMMSFNRHSDSTRALHVSVYPSGIAKDDLSFRVDADDWDELLAAVRAKWDEHKDRHRSQTIRKMALEIIRITADLGECTDAALRDRFNAGEIRAYGKDACADANTIAGKGPFTIKAMKGANAA